MGKRLILLVSLLLVGLTSGCATIVGSPTQVVPIGSSPNGADIVVTDERGMDVFAGKTPASVTLNKSDGSYWGKKRYMVKISKPGYKEQTIPITASPNGWYIGGNLVFGGLIGWFIVDPLNGNMYNLSPEHINTTLAAEGQSHNNTAADGSIAVMLIEDVPQSLRSKMVRVK